MLHHLLYVRLPFPFGECDPRIIVNHRLSRYHRYHDTYCQEHKTRALTVFLLTHKCHSPSDKHLRGQR
jgi:hypothetical protein